MLRDGCAWVAGVDEVGRGPLAGPVFAAAAILDPADLPRSPRDSKALTEAQRENAFAEIMEKALAVAVASASCAEIDAINIRAASLLAMRRAVLALALRPDAALIDGRDAPDVPMRAVPVIGGDAIVLSIAAASIVAKVTRDRLMTRLDAHCPGYGFASHKGYAAAAHRAAITRQGPSRFHRMSFGLLKTFA
ncbi:MAG: ribonuclease HII [Rhizobiales bacterium 65-9]|nr:MAG: ribonuclease HII [Rhizobiales bacterium 65-9]